MTTRPAGPEDLEFLAAVYASTRQDEVAAWGWPVEQQQSFIRMQFNARRMSYQAAFADAEVSILLACGKPAGSVIVHRNADEIRLVDIAFLPQYRNQGFGTQVICRLIEESGRSRIPLRLSVLRGNRAVRLYERLGFMVSESDPMYIEMERDPCRKT